MKCEAKPSYISSILWSFINVHLKTSSNLRYCWISFCGKYRLVILVSAANTIPIEKTFEISLTGEWYDDEKKMLGEGIGIRLL